MTRSQEFFCIIFGIFIVLVYLAHRKKPYVQSAVKKQKSIEKNRDMQNEAITTDPSVIPVRLNEETDVFINLRERDIPGFWKLDLPGYQ